MKLKYINDRNVRLRWGPQTLEDEFECLGAYGVSKDTTVQVLGRILGGTGRGMVPEIPDSTRAPAGQPTNESADVNALEEQAGSKGSFSMPPGSTASEAAASATSGSASASSASAAPPAASSEGVSGASDPLTNASTALDDDDGARRGRGGGDSV